MSEADTCRVLVLPKILEAGWDSATQITEQLPITDGRINVENGLITRGPKKKPDYILRINTALPIAVIEVKKEDLSASEGLQQSINYAEMLGVRWAYSTNGHTIIQRDLELGTQETVEKFPSPEDLWGELSQGNEWSNSQIESITQPPHHDQNRRPRYYQTKAINRAVESISGGENKALLCLATGTGKSFIASQICYRLWRSKWNRKGEANRRPRILYLADRVVLIHQPKDTVFSPFGDALHVIKQKAVMSREMYFATYHAIAGNAARPGLYKEYSPDFFDLIVVDECHRGSSSEDSKWREVLDYFEGSAKLGMTATPLREDNRDTYDYFGPPLIQYSLKQGIDDGFLAPYRVRRIVTDIDAVGWRPEKGQTDDRGRIIPDYEYGTADFERTIILPKRTEKMAEYIVNFLKSTNPWSKSIIFCVDQPHALAMRDAISRLVPEFLSQNSDYVCRITSDEGEVGRNLLERFQDVDSSSPVIVTTSQLLTTGVDAPTVSNIILCRNIGTIGTFKQIIGRGTRLREDYDKFFFNILDFTGTATRNFADPDFDGYPDVEEEDTIDGELIDSSNEEQRIAVHERTSTGRLRHIVDDVDVTIIGEMEQELCRDGNRLSTTKISEMVGGKIKTMFRDINEFQDSWENENLRNSVISELEENGLDLDYLMEYSPSEDIDAFDLLCYFSYGAPILSRSERANAVKRGDFWLNYQSTAREVLSAILDQYVEYGSKELKMPDVLHLPKLKVFGNPSEISEVFGGITELKLAWDQLQHQLYNAGE